MLTVYLSCRLAGEHGLHLLYKEEFHHIFEAEREHRDFKPLLQRMKVVSASGESQMDEDQWDAASALFSLLPGTLDVHPIQQIYIWHSRL